MDSGIDIAATAEAVEQTAMLERMRLDMTTWHEIRGFAPQMPADAMAAWQVRVARIEAGAALLKILAEPAIAAQLGGLDPRIIIHAGVVVPSGPLWPT